MRVDSPRPYFDEASERKIASLVRSLKKISVLTITTEGDDGALKMQAASEGSECEELNRDERCGWPGAKREKPGGRGAGRGCWMTSWQGGGWAEEGPCAGSR